LLSRIFIIQVSTHRLVAAFASPEYPIFISIFINQQQTNSLATTTGPTMDSNMIIGGRVETLTTENCTAEDLAAMVAKVLAKNHAEGTLTLNEGNIVMDMYDDFGIDFCSVVRRLHLGTVSRFLTSEACSAFVSPPYSPFLLGSIIDTGVSLFRSKSREILVMGPFDT